MSGRHNSAPAQGPSQQRPKLSVNTNVPSQSYNGQSTNRTPIAKAAQGLANLGKKVLRRAGSSPAKADANKSPEYVLHGQSPLLTLERPRNLDLGQTLPDRQIIAARSRLQNFRANFTRDIPQLKFRSGQAQINAVVEYLMIPCSTDMEESQTALFVRHSHTSLRAWKEFLDMRWSEPSRAYRRWNVVEARRRVRRNNTLIEEFNASWDAWVSEQKPEVQTAARRHPGRDELHSQTGDLFRDLYHCMLVACDAEIEQRQDIAEALILQYPTSFPGFKTNRGDTVGSML